MERRIEHNVAQLREEIAAVCASCGRNEQDVTLVAVSKQQAVDKIFAAQKAGIALFGENRAQELLAKQKETADRVRWHFIGHLQTNKIKHIFPVAELIHSIDSIHLAEAVAELALKRSQTAEILLQVNASGETSKYGFEPESLPETCYQISGFNGLEVRGLMTIAPYTADVKVLADSFSSLRQLFEQVTKQALQRFRMSYLSMGMSNDYKIALKEGSNMLRIGSAIFGPRN
jgi:pyridoxal phosphate enzyme (YggS family)